MSARSRLEMLHAAFGHALKVQPHERYLYSYDATGIVGLPDAVLHLRTTEEMRHAVLAARDAGVALVPRGSGTGLSGGCVATNGEVVITCEALRRILALDVSRLRVWVEAGVVTRSLEAYLLPYTLFYAPDPASHRVTTIAGNIAENSGGPRAVKYGVTGQHVMRLHVVDAAGQEGTLVSDECQPALDLVSLVVGSEGTLALLVSAELALERRSDAISTLLVSFPTMAHGTAFVSAVIARGALPSALEFLDRHSIDCVEEWGVVKYPADAGAVLLLDLDGSPEEVARRREDIRALALSMGAFEVDVAQSEEEREALWLGRRGVYAALARHAKRMLTQDITVPRERLTEMLNEVERIAGSYGLEVATVGHAGDGNLHPDFRYDPDDAEMSRRVHDANREILEVCVALGGSVTGEHGIGSDKLPYLSLMYGPEEIGLMAAVKRALDPNGLFNPGKAVPMVDRKVPAGAGRAVRRPRTVEGVRDAVLHARSSGAPLRIHLDALNHVAPDPANMTVEVGAGASLDEVEAALAGTTLCFPVTPVRERQVGRALLVNDYGPDHLNQGLFRQSLLAATYVTGCGEIVRMGRAVVKNVAGYDLFRPLVGSEGKLAVPVSFVFRLRPREDVTWAEHMMSPDAVLSRAEHPGLVAALARIEKGGVRVSAAFRHEVPEGWYRIDGVDRVREMQATLRGASDILDIAFAPTYLPSVLKMLPAVPIGILPAAARVFVPLDRATARELSRGIETGVGHAVRARWGPSYERLHQLDSLTAAWERKLVQCFDPARILGEWLQQGGSD